MRKPSPKKVPYISFSVDRLPALLELIKSSGPMEKDALIRQASESFSRSRKTIQEFVISLKNLGLVKEENGKISLTESSSRMMMNNRKDFWEILRQELLENVIVSNILDAIFLMSEEEKKVTSNEEYYHSLSRVLQNRFSFSSAPPRELDRFITLFRRIKILDYDPYSDEYFLVRKNSMDDKSLETLLIQEYKEIKKEMEKRTGTSWVPIDQLRSKICMGEGIETEVVNRFLKGIWDKNRFQFAEASASRKEVRKGGIEKNGKIYFYVKIIG